MTKKKPNARKKPILEAMANLIADSHLSSVPEAAIKHGVSKRTVTRYRDQAASDPMLATKVKERIAELNEKTSEALAQLFLKATARLDELMNDPACPPSLVKDTCQMLLDRKAADEIMHAMLDGAISKGEKKDDGL